MKYIFSKYETLPNLIFVLVLSLLFITKIEIKAQATGDPREDFLYGEYYVEQGQFKKALPFFLSALNTNEGNCNILYRIGYCYSNIRGKEDLALQYLEKAVINIDENYIPGRYKSFGAPMHSWLLLGDSYHRINDLKNASFAYHEYKQSLSPSDKEQIEIVTKKIVGLGISFETQRSSVDVNIFNLGERINTRFSDYNPVLTGDQKTLIYTSYWETIDRIMISKRNKLGWITPVEINDQLNIITEACYTTALSYSGDELYLIKKLNEYNSDIYVSKYKDGQWQPIEALGKEINSNNLESSACISRDGKTLYFSSNRRGGVGGFDIYKAVRAEDGTWKDIENLGPAINTEKDEEAPFLSYDCKTFYFSSDGHESVGRMDILFSEIDENDNFSRPQNMGVPFNTTDDDVFFQYFKDTKTGYFSRELNNSIGKQDIFIIQYGEYIPDWIEPDMEVDFISVDSLENQTTKIFGVEETYSTKKKTLTNEEQKHIDSLKTRLVWNDTAVKYIDLAEKESSINEHHITQSSTLTSKEDINVPDSRNASINQDVEGGVTTSSYGGSAIAATTVAGGTATISSVSVAASGKGAQESRSSNLEVNTEEGLAASSYTTRTYTSSEDEDAAQQATAYEENTEGLEPQQMQSASLDQKTEAGLPEGNQVAVASTANTVEGGTANISPVSVSTSGQAMNEGRSSDLEGSTEEGLAASSYTTRTYTSSEDEDAAQQATAYEENTEGLEPQQMQSASLDQKTEAELAAGDQVAVASTANTVEGGTANNSPVSVSTSGKASQEGRSSDLESSTEEELAYRSHQTELQTNTIISNNETYTSEIQKSELSKQNINTANPGLNLIASKYTIQIIALKKPRDAQYFKSLQNIIVSKGTDGFYRYTYGEYDTIDDALEQIEKIKSMGFSDAFIRNVELINNYKDFCEYNR